MNVVIIGGVAAGMSTASKLSRLDSSINITVLEKSGDISYGACGLPYVLGDVILDFKSLQAKSLKDFDKEGIRVLLHHEAIAVNTSQKHVIAKDLKQQEEKTFKYDKLVIASGARAMKLPFNQASLEGIYTLRTLADGKQLKAALDKPSINNVIVVGSGYIGLEVIENLIALKKQVRVIEQADRLLPSFEPFVSENLDRILKESGCKVHLNERLKQYLGKQTVTQVKTDKDTYSADLVIEAVGIKPATEFLNNTDIKRLKNGAIITDETMQTNIKDIYAAGDCATYRHRLTGENVYIPLGTHANKAGRIIAQNIAGISSDFKGVIGSSVLKVFDYEIAHTGLLENEAGKNASSVLIRAKSIAGYYPGAQPIEVNIVYDQTTHRLLGATMMGKSGVAHRINMLAVAITQEMTTEDYSQLDLAYAPPFSPVYDPTQIATNQVRGAKNKE